MARPTTPAAVGQLTYDQAVVMLAVLASSADGRPQPQEDAVIARILAPVLRRLGPDGQRSTMTLLRQLLDGIGFDNTVTSIRGAMVSPRDRLDAVRLAVSVAFADGQVGKKEAEHVADLALVMGLSEDEFRSVLPASAPGAGKVTRKSAAGPTSPDEAVLMLAVLAGSADGVPQDEEARVIAARLAATLGRLGPAGRSQTLSRLTDLVNDAGFDGALEAIRAGLPSHHERYEAVRIAGQVVLADRKITRHERSHLERVGLTMGLSADDLAAMLPR